MAGTRRWMNAVAMMIPEPKYLANLCQFVRNRNGTWAMKMYSNMVCGL